MRLIELVNQMKGGISTQDGTVDQLVRSLSNLPVRPADKSPYEGIFAVKDAVTGRQKAIEQLRTFMTTLDGELNPLDGFVDNAIRELTGLPDRPADKQPYASLFAAAKFKLITAQNLAAIATRAPADRLAKLAQALNRTFVEFDIVSFLRQAHFLAQIAHESDEFNAFEEYASGAEYEWRDDLGNVYSGDGVRYKGRGLIQITGRTNYRNCGQALGVDLIANPKRLADFDLASRSAGWFWETHGLNPIADRDDVEQITLIINGGLNGYDHRVQLLGRAKQVLR